jgi:hypothetical protein
VGVLPSLGINLGFLVFVDFLEFFKHIKSRKFQSCIQIVEFWALVVVVVFVFWIFQDFSKTWKPQKLKFFFCLALSPVSPALGEYSHNVCVLPRLTGTQPRFLSLG